MKTLSILSAARLCTSARALQFGAPFPDHMVLQCDKPLPIRGKGEPGEQVTVTLDQEVRECTAGPTGKWEIEFSPRKASFDPVRLEVRGENSRKTCRDILVGEVWFCSGQSNMQRRLKDTNDAKTYAAQAWIINKNTVELTSRDGKHPVEVHYAYEADPIVNRVNSADRPASPCRLLIEK